MRVLVTGAGGFVGRHMTKELVAAGHTPIGFDQNALPASGEHELFTGDIRDPDGLNQLVDQLKPDGCIHLAGIAWVPTGWIDPHLVFSVNLVGTINLLEAFRVRSPETRIVVVTSSEVYGRSPAPRALDEDSPLAPANPYSVSKMGADLAALLDARRYGMPVMTARPDNHTGPGQSPLFVTSSFAEQLADISLGKAEPVMRVGNLESERAFTDVRDVVRAYRLLLEKGRPAQAYNISSGRMVQIRAILDHLCVAANVTPQIEIDPERFRPADTMPVLDISRIRNEVQWEPEIPLETTLRDVYLDALHSRTQTAPL